MGVDLFCRERREKGRSVTVISNIEDVCVCVLGGGGGGGAAVLFSINLYSILF
jgi:hypothetical protein